MEELLGEPLVLASEDEVAVVGVFLLAVDFPPLSREIEEFTVGIAGEEVRETVIVGYIELVPVVKTCALELLVCDLEAERSDKVQSCARNGAGAGNVPRILRYLRFYKDDVEIMHSFPSVIVLFGIKCLYTAIIRFKINTELCRNVHIFRSEGCIMSDFDTLFGHIMPPVVQPNE